MSFIVRYYTGSHGGKLRWCCFVSKQVVVSSFSAETGLELAAQQLSPDGLPAEANLKLIVADLQEIIAEKDSHIRQLELMHSKVPVGAGPSLRARNRLGLVGASDRHASGEATTGHSPSNRRTDLPGGPGSHGAGIHGDSEDAQSLDESTAVA